MRGWTAWLSMAVVGAVAAGAVVVPPAARGASAGKLPASRQLVVMSGSGSLALINAGTGARLESLGHFGDQVDPGLAYSISDRAVFFLQLQKRHEELVEVSTVTKRLTDLAPASAFALAPNGRRVAYVTADGRGTAVRKLADGTTTSWSPGRALAPTETLAAIAWRTDTSALVQPAPDATATASAAEVSPDPQPWFALSAAARTLAGRALTPPTLTGGVAFLSHDSAPPGHVFAVTDRSPSQVLLLTLKGGAVRAAEVAQAMVTVALALGPMGRRLAFVENHERAGAEHIDLEVCVIGLTGGCRAQLLEPDARLGQVAWAGT